MRKIKYEDVILRAVIPIGLFFASTIRYNVFSFVYFLLFLGSPFLRRPSEGSSNAGLKTYLIVLATTSISFSLSHPILYVLITLKPSFNDLLSNCSFGYNVSSAIGVQKFNMEVYRAMRLLVPDIIVMLISILALIFFARYPRRSRSDSASGRENDEEEALQSPQIHENGDDVTPSVSQPIEGVLVPVPGTVLTVALPNLWMLNLLTVVLVAAAGVTVPSVLSAFYLLSFYVTCTYWSSCKNLYNHNLAWTRIVLLIYSALHLCLFYLYQFQYAQLILPDGSFVARLLGLNYLIRADCSHPGEVMFPTDKPLFVYFAPIATLFVYLSVAVEIIANNEAELHGGIPKWISLKNLNLSSAAHRHSMTQRQRQQVMEELNQQEPSTSLNEPLLLNANQNTASEPPEQVNRLALNQTLADLDDPSTSETVVPGNNGGSDGEVRFTARATLPDTSVMSNASAMAGTSSRGWFEHSHPQTPLQQQAQQQQFSSQPVYDVFPFMVAPRFRQQYYSASVVAVDGVSGAPRVRLLNGCHRHRRHCRHQGGSAGDCVCDFNGGLDDNGNFFSPLTQRPLLLSLLNSTIRNSYILTFVAMMAWSVIFRSWLSFILLLSACILWILPNSRLACLYCSPLIVAYGMCIIGLQYIYCFDLTEAELPTYLPERGLNLTEIGLHRWPIPVWPLALQLMFLVFFWLNLRLFVLEWSANTEASATSGGPRSVASSVVVTAAGVGAVHDLEEEQDATAGTTTSTTVATVANGNTSSEYGGVAVVDNVRYRKFTSFLHYQCVRYWIGLCCLTMLLFSLRRPVVVFRVVYMVLLLYFFIVFMVSYRFWRKQMLAFWWIYVIYSIAVLLCTYTYQFTFFPYYWQNGTGLSPQILKAIGLEQFDRAELFDRLMMPVAFMVVIILQMHYFHEPFLYISDLDRYRDYNEEERSRNNQQTRSSTRHNYTDSLETQSNFIEDFHSVFNMVTSSIRRFLRKSRTVAWRFAEVHWIKVVCFLVMFSVIKEVTITNIIPVIVVVTCFPFPFLHGFLVTFIFCFTGLQIVMKMLFQLDIVSDVDYANVIASGAPNNPAQPKSSITSLLPNGTGKWIGLDVVEDFPKYITPLALLLVACVFWHLIKYRQLQYYRKPGSVRPKPGIIFPEMTFDSMNERLVNFLKCVANYTFYKLGLEICFCTTVIAACIRVDALSVLYLLLMLIFLFTHSRTVCSRLWFAYMTFLGILLVIQYAACSQIPSVLVESLPWDSTDNETIRLQQWLFLPSTSYQPDPRKLIVDFLQFLLVAAQWRVFKLEQRPDWEAYGGGSNKPVLSDTLPGPTDHDFVSTKESYLDYLRHAVFYWSYWLSLAIVFATGVSWITLFCLGYMILSFIYLWMGQNVMMRRRHNLLASWNVIVGYNFCVILAKCSLQLMGCVYWNRLAGHRICWLIQLFGISCMNPVGWNEYAGYSKDIGCETVSNGLHWDVVCFAVIIIQRKIFTTSSFRHVIFDLDVQSLFASRGALLVNRKLMQVIREQNEREKRDLERVQRKLDKIAQRQREAGKNTANLTEHYMLIRSGDYYQFDGDPEDEDDDDETVASPTLTSSTTPTSHRAQPDTRQQQQYTRNLEPSTKTVLTSASGSQTAQGFRNTFRLSKQRLQAGGSGNAEHGSVSSSTSVSSFFAPIAANATTLQQLQRIRGHRRMSSYPETLLGGTKKQQLMRAGSKEEDGAIELQALPPRKLSASGSKGQPDAPVKSGTYQKQQRGHRRFASAGPIGRPEELATASTSKPTEKGAAEDGESSNVMTGLSLRTSQPNRPSVTFASTRGSPDPGTMADDETGTGGGALDFKSDEMDVDDDYTFTRQVHMNPFQLLNQAMDRGVCSAARQFRRRNVSHHQQQRNLAALEGGGTPGERKSSALMARPPLSKQSTVEGTATPGAPFEDDPLLVASSKRVDEDRDMFDRPDSSPDTPKKPGGSVLIAARKFSKGPSPDDDTLSRGSDREGSSTDYGDDVDEACADQKREEGCWSRFKASCLVLHIFVLSTIETTTVWLNAITRDHRRIRRTIDLEKRMVKQIAPYIFSQSNADPNSSLDSESNYNHRHHHHQHNFYPVYRPDLQDEDSRTLLELVVSSVISGGVSPNRNPAVDPGIYYLLRRILRNREHSSAFQLSVGWGETTPVEEGVGAASWEQREREFRRSRPSLFLLLIAVGNLVVVHSELVCYTFLIINHMRSANVLSLVYPLMVFLWGMLSVPRPTKNFWITLITYTELVIIVKYICQFRFIEFNSPDQLSATLAKTHWLPVIFGVEKTESYAIWDLIQLLLIFLHRSYLKNYGLWRDDTEFKQDLIGAVEANKNSSKKTSQHSQNSQTKPQPNPQVREDFIVPYAKAPLIAYQQQQQSRHHGGHLRADLGTPGGGGSTRNPLVKMRRFYRKMTDPRFNQKVDVYVYMFICEFLSFWIIIFGYQSFGPSTGMGDNAFEFIKTNRIPLPFIGMIIVQSVFIVTDRAMFLRKQVLGKFVFLIFHVILIHVWLFFILPQITMTPFNMGSARALLYLVKCIYFGLSAYQIRSGYPRHILGNFLTKKYNYINLVLFKAYLIMPFLYEVRSVMDWMWTDSPLSLYHWMELEDIYAKVFVMKCWRRSEIAYPTGLGRKRSICVKYVVGLLILLFAFVCFWGPLVVAAFIDTTFAINVPIECSQTLTIGGFPALYFFTSQENALLHVNTSFLSDLRQCNALDQATSGFVDNFKTEDVSNMTFGTTSERVWSITPPMYRRLMTQLADEQSPMTMSFHVVCRRPSRAVDLSSTRVEQYFNRPLSWRERGELITVLNESLTSPSASFDDDFNETAADTTFPTSRASVRLDLAFPRFLFAQRDRLRNASSNLAQSYTYINVSASLQHDPLTAQRWWRLEELGLAAPPCYASINNISQADMAFRDPRRSLSIVIFNERVSDNLLGKIFSSYGIIGMYAAYIFFASRLLRMIYSDISYHIALQELPHVDRLLNLCHDIYLVRENGQLYLEEQLFAKLIFLYRSSETMIKWTRHPKWLIDKFTKKPEDETEQEGERGNMRRRRRSDDNGGGGGGGEDGGSFLRSPALPVPQSEDETTLRYRGQTARDQFFANP